MNIFVTFYQIVKAQRGFGLILMLAVAIGLLPVAVDGIWPGTKPAFGQIIQVKPGNRNAKQPKIPSGAFSRTRSTKGSFEGKYQKIYQLLSKNKKLIRKIKSSAKRFGIDPIHMIGALVGEHTYNVDALDHLQTYYVKAMSYMGSDLTFKYGSEKVLRFVARPEFSKCGQYSNSYDLWACRENIWNSKFRGKKTGGIAWPNDRFGRVFFQPLFAGQTFGLGQLNPLTALRVSDLVSATTRKRKLNAKNAPQVYKTIMDPDSSLDYMAAVLKTSIDAYRKIGGFDISANPGITATLYNLGDVRNRARKAASRKPKQPEENYYGWLINEKEMELRNLL